MGVDIRTLQVGEPITIYEPGEYYGLTGKVYATNGEEAALSVNANNAYPYWIRLHNAQYMERYKGE